MKIRGCDRWGCGHFGAPRGKRKHMGVDLEYAPGSPVEALTPGTVSKLGYPYADDLHFRYVEITDDAGARWRYFYVDPRVTVGQYVEAYQEIGVSQYLGLRYPGITEHVHIEIIKADGEYLDPTGVIQDR